MSTGHQFFTPAQIQQEKIEQTRAVTSDRLIKTLPPLPEGTAPAVVDVFSGYEAALEAYCTADEALAEAEAKAAGAALAEATEISRLVRAGEDPMAASDIVAESDRDLRRAIAVHATRAQDLQAALTRVYVSAPRWVDDQAALMQPRIDEAGERLRKAMIEVSEARAQLNAVGQIAAWWTSLAQGGPLPNYGRTSQAATTEAIGAWTVTDTQAAQLDRAMTRHSIEQGQVDEAVRENDARDLKRAALEGFNQS